MNVVKVDDVGFEIAQRPLQLTVDRRLRQEQRQEQRVWFDGEIADARIVKCGVWLVCYHENRVSGGTLAPREFGAMHFCTAGRKRHEKVRDVRDAHQD